MIDGKHLNRIFERNLYVIHKELEGVTDEESFIQPPFRGNCINWVVGHLAASRKRTLYWLGIETNMLSEEHYQRYLWGSDPILEKEEGLLSLEEGLVLIEKMGEMLKEKLESITNEELAKEVGEGDNTGPRVDKVEFMAWHEGYHSGQFEYLRQLVGKDDQIL